MRERREHCQCYLILDSRFWEGETHMGGKFDAFFDVFFCILGVFLGGGGNLGFWGECPRRGEIPQEIAGNNTGTLWSP